MKIKKLTFVLIFVIYVFCELRISSFNRSPYAVKLLCSHH